MLRHTDIGYSHKGGRYTYYCTVTMPDGKKVRVKHSSKKRSVAIKKINDELEDMARSVGDSVETLKIAKEPKEDVVISEPTKILSDELIDYAKAKYKGKVKTTKKKYKPRTVSDKKELIRNLVTPYDIGQMPVDKITRKDISDWLDELEVEGKSDKRRKGAYNLLTDYYGNYYCAEVDPSFSNPANGFSFSIKKSKVEVSAMYSDFQIKQYLQACEDEGHNADILQLIFYIYCRPGEAATLMWKDWPHQDSILRIQRDWSKDETGASFVDDRPKTKASQRDIYLPDYVHTMLFLRYEARDKLKPEERSEWIFPAFKDHSKPISESTLYEMNKRIVKKADLPPIRVHDLRHIGISFAIRHSDKNRLSAISRQAGHSSTSITQDIYEYVLDEQQKELAKATDLMLDKITPKPNRDAEY